jgi:DNA-binding MarR family transcriptional regulator
MAATTSALPKPQVESLGWLLAQASHVLHTQLTAALEDHGISPRAFGVLKRAMTGEFTQIELAHAAGIDKTTMVVTLDGLEAAGLAERVPDPRDRRARVVKVTKAGEQKVAEAKAIVDAVNASVLDALPANQRKTFIDVLTRLTERELATPAVCSQTVRRPRSG